MKPTTSMTIVALVIAAITAGSAAPALAQDQGGERGRQMHQHRNAGEFRPGARHDGPRDGNMRMHMNRGGGLFALVCSERGSDGLAHMLLNIEQQTDPTAEQQPLYDTLKDAALSAQADFATVCATARPAEGDVATRDLADRLKVRLDIEKAHVEAMTAVLPAFEAFYDSLSDEQKLQLEPRRHRAEHRMPGEPGEHHGQPDGPGRNG
jgi:hypothetical protein